MLESLAVSLGLTLLLELAFALLWGVRGRRELTVVCLANCLTNPALVLLHHTAIYAWGWHPVPVAAALELAAVLAEWRCYLACSEQIKRPLLFAALANAFSYGAGRMLSFLLLIGNSY